MQRLSCCLLACALTFAACHQGPVLTGGSKQPSVGGTIAGFVTTADSTVALPGRKVTAIETTTGSRYDATTGINGGYTIKVPEGTYRIEVELQAGEALAKQPAPTRVNKSDLDPRRNFVITVKPPPTS